MQASTMLAFVLIACLVQLPATCTGSLQQAGRNLLQLHGGSQNHGGADNPWQIKQHRRGWTHHSHARRLHQRRQHSHRRNMGTLLDNQDEDDRRRLQPSKCPGECLKFGTCNEELGRCDCPRHRSGEDCSVEPQNISALCKSYSFSKVSECISEDSHVHCLNGCNGVGDCVAGFCFCRPGYFGADCSLSLDSEGKPQLLAGQGYKPRERGPKIYVYELPPDMNHLRWNLRRFDRPLFLLFWQRLLSSGVRVADGEDADYYFIPIKLRMGYGDYENADKAVAYIRQHWPWWDRHGGGGKHIVIATGDMGRDEISNRHILDKSIWLTHWGLTKLHPIPKWKASHRPGQDIVIPVYIQPGLVDSGGVHSTVLHPKHPKHNKERPTTFFFSGRICGNRKPPRVDGVFPNCEPPTDRHGNIVAAHDGYSAAVRQKVHFYHHNRTGYKILLGTKKYGEELSDAKYCLAPTGGGHGKRQVQVSLMGCIPVTITDKVLQPFEPEINWNEFSVPVLEEDIPRMHEILDAISEEQLAELQRHLWCGAQHLFWSSIFGGVLGDDGRYDAFETTMEILRMRLRRPDLKPEQYGVEDEEFRKFMHCETLPQQQDPPDLCSHSKTKTKAFKCDQCAKGKSTLGIPGGAICCTERHLAKCARLWD